MTSFPYYYDPPGSENTIQGPGELCDLCGKLRTIVPAGTLISFPPDAAMQEYGIEEAHAHVECAKPYLHELQEQVKAVEAALAARRNY